MISSTLGLAAMALALAAGTYVSNKLLASYDRRKAAKAASKA